MSERISSLENLFMSDGQLKRPVKLQKDFLRPAYQYTSQEIRNWQRESWIEEVEKNN